jgi:hypothetical protein
MSSLAFQNHFQQNQTVTLISASSYVACQLQVFSDDKIQLVEWSTSAVFSFPKPVSFNCDDRSSRMYCVHVDMILKDRNGKG